MKEIDERARSRFESGHLQNRGDEMVSIGVE